MQRLRGEGRIVKSGDRQLVEFGSCHQSAPRGGSRLGRRQGPEGAGLTVALAGNANVGKSLIFNRITGSNQTIGNWPGKTVERAEGILRVDGRAARVVDLPGLYSLSAFSDEESVTREYIAQEKPDVIVNVVSAAVLERNLFFTLQLMEMGLPMVLCLNQVDVARGKGIVVDEVRLEKILGIPVVSTVAASGRGIRKLVGAAVAVAERKRAPAHDEVWLDDGIEARVRDLAALIECEKTDLGYPSRWLAVKLLEGDAGVREMVGRRSAKAVQAAEDAARQLEESRGQPAFVAVASARYALAGRIAQDVQRRTEVKRGIGDRIDWLTTHGVFGYVASFAVIAALLLWTFTVGDLLSGWLSDAFAFFQPVDPRVDGPIISILWNGAFGGLVAGATLVLPYVAPFYLMLAALEDSGVLTRVAFMMDSAMHRMGLHGKAIIPIILGYGCNVPAIYSTRIMGTRRERMLAAFAITFAPCTARTIIILGLVAAFVGIWWALAVYVLNLLVMFAAVRLLAGSIRGDSTGLIMEMHSFKVPSLSVMAKQTWARARSLVVMVFPIYVIASAGIQAAYALGILDHVGKAFSFLTVGLLGLPTVAGVLLIFGAARKELILLMAVVLFGENLLTILSPAQLVVLALVATIYPCMATIGVLTREFGWKVSWALTAANVAAALVVGGVFIRLLPFVL